MLFVFFMWKISCEFEINIEFSLFVVFLVFFVGILTNRCDARVFWRCDELDSDIIEQIKFWTQVGCSNGIVFPIARFFQLRDQKIGWILGRIFPEKIEKP